MDTERIFPAIFHKDDEQYWVEFPDIPGCFSQGETIEEAYKMAKAALALALDGEDNKNAKPSNIENIAVSGNDKVMLVEANSGEDIIYFQNPVIPHKVDEGLDKRHLTKYQVAEILGVSRSYVTRIASGERVPSVDMAKRIGLLLDFDWKIFYQNQAYSND
jgi:antitoxin HicB